ncbi:hypothetical protein [Rossellomorea sp. y25]|uniref:hypothetical protein n=1 Tax=Rossellomorea sp. y25 TaxID=3118174 RepID=UPI0030E034A7
MNAVYKAKLELSQNGMITLPESRQRIMNLKRGFRSDYKILRGSYMMERQNLKTYGDKHHMMLLDYSTSEKKIWIGI